MSSSDENDLTKESMAPQPVEIQTSFTQPQVGLSSFTSGVNPPISLKDWAESLIELAETSSSLAPSPDRDLTYQEFSDTFSSAQEKLSTSNTLLPPSHINTVVTCAVVSSYEELQHNPLDDNSIFNALNEFQDFASAQRNEMPRTSTSNFFQPFGLPPNDQTEISQKFKVNLSEIRQEVAAYVPALDTRESISTPMFLPAISAPSPITHQSHPSSRSLQQPGVEMKTEERFSHSAQRPGFQAGLTLRSKPRSTDKDVSELLPTTLPIHDIDMLSTYDFDIDADIYVHDNTEAGNSGGNLSTTMAFSFPSHNPVQIDRSSKILSERSLANTDVQIPSHSRSIYSETNFELNPHSTVTQPQERELLIHTFSPAHHSLFTNLTDNRQTTTNPSSFNSLNITQHNSLTAPLSHRHQLTRSSSDPVSQLSYRNHVPSPRPLFMPKLHHQFSLPFETHLSHHDHLHARPSPFYNFNTSTEATFSRFEQISSPSIQSPYPTPSPQASTQYSKSNKGSSIFQTQTQVTVDPVNPDLSLPIAIPPSQGEVNRTSSSSFQNKLTTVTTSGYTPLYSTHCHGSSNVDEFDIWEVEDSSLSFTEELNMCLPEAQSSSEIHNVENTPSITRFATSHALSDAQTVDDDDKLSGPSQSGSLFYTKSSTSTDFPGSLNSSISTTLTTSSSISTNSPSVSLPTTPTSSLDSTYTLVPLQDSTPSRNALSRSLSKDSENSTELNFETTTPTATSTEPKKTAKDSQVSKIRPDLQKHPGETFKASSSSYLVKLHPSSEPVSPDIKASLRTKLKGKGKQSKPAVLTDFSDLLQSIGATVSRRKSRKRSLEIKDDPDLEKKKTKARKMSPGPSTSTAESPGSSQTAPSTVQAEPKPSTSGSHRIIESSDVSGPSSMEASEASTSESDQKSVDVLQGKKTSDKETKRVKNVNPFAQREKNRLSARACRFKKQLKIERLLAEVKRLEEKQTRMKGEIGKMSVERVELQQMLDNHQPYCKMKK